MHFYKELQEGQVDFIRRWLVEKLLERACDELMIEKPRVRWFVEADIMNATFKQHTPMAGAATSGEILISATEDIDRTAEITLHELRHCSQIERGGTESEVYRELDAGKYGQAGYRAGFGDLIDQAKTLKNLAM